MSIDSAKAFVERMKSDAEFRTKINEAKDPEEAKKLIADAGLDFTKEEYDEVRTELSDDDLAQVAGGCVCGCLGKYHCPSML